MEVDGEIDGAKNPRECQFLQGTPGESSLAGENNIASMR